MFKDDVLNYKTYSDDEFYMTKAPDSRDFLGGNRSICS